MARKEYTQQFREQACRLVKEEGYSMAQAARSLGMHPNTLWNWLRPRGPADQPLDKQGGTTARGDAAAADPPDPKALQIQVRELEAKVRRLEMEKEILKKATAYFATLHP
jgi:transposase